MKKLVLLLGIGSSILLLSKCANKPEQLSIKDSFNLEASLTDILKDEYGLFINKDVKISSTEDFNKLSLVLIGETIPNADIRLVTLGMDKTDKFLFNKIIYLQISDNMINPNKEKPCATLSENLTINGKGLSCVREIYSKGTEYTAIIEHYINSASKECVYFMEKKYAKNLTSKLNELIIKSIDTNKEIDKNAEELMKQKINDSINTNSIEEVPPPPDNTNNNDKIKNVYSYAEEMPEFPGGPESLMKFIAENIEYPLVAKEKGIAGRVYVQFVVLSDGKIGEVTILRGVDPLLDAEAIRVIKKFPMWKPGKQNGKFVNVLYTLPVNFKLE
jgi:TonB family protein